MHITYTFFLKASRLVFADSWVFFGLKWNAFENGKKKTRGVTPYANKGKLSWDLYTEHLQKNLSLALETFSLPLGELVGRQKEVLEQIVKEPFSDLGISLAVGKIFASSAHTDLDSGFTFSGKQIKCMYQFSPGCCQVGILLEVSDLLKQLVNCYGWHDIPLGTQ